VTNENKTLRFEMVQQASLADPEVASERIRELEEELEKVKSSFKTPGMVSDINVDVLLKELHACNEQNARLRSLLKKERQKSSSNLP